MSIGTSEYVSQGSFGANPQRVQIQMGCYWFQTQNLVNFGCPQSGRRRRQGEGHSKSIHPKLLKTLTNPEDKYLVCWLSSGLKYHGSNQDHLRLNWDMFDTWVCKPYLSRCRAATLIQLRCRWGLGWSLKHAFTSPLGK